MTANLQYHYDELWRRSASAYLKNELICEPALDDLNDNRYGVTLLVRPSQEVIRSINAMMDSLTVVIPGQYFYPPYDMHLTVFPVIPGTRGLTLAQVDLEPIVAAIEPVITATPPFTVAFRGITASPSCVIVQGFPQGDVLDRLKRSVQQVLFPHDPTPRYPATAHVSFLRFRKPVDNSAELHKMLTCFRHTGFGSATFHTIDLVFNDWYQKSARVTHLLSWNLQGPGEGDGVVRQALQSGGSNR